MDAEPNSEAFDELEVLATLVENYEMKHYALNLKIVTVINLPQR